MKLIFKTNSKITPDTALIFTHPQAPGIKQQIEMAIHGHEQTITVIDPTNSRNIQVPLSAIISVESEDRMCQIRLRTGALYLYPKRLKYAEIDFANDGFIRINSQALVNLRDVKQFAPTTNARIEITLSDGSSYYISRHYIKNFRRSLQ